MMDSIHSKNDMKNILEVFQVCDSTFPIGTFNHSFGMENYESRRVMRKAAAFREWITNYFRSQYRYGEGFLVILCYAALDGNAGDEAAASAGLPAGAPPPVNDAVNTGSGEETAVLETLLRYDDIITKSTIAAETRDGAKMIARQMYLLIEKMYGDTVPYLSSYAKNVEEDAAYGNPAIVFSLFAFSRGIPVQDAFEMYGYSVASTLVQNAVRSVPLGQREGQVILKGVIGLIGNLYEKSRVLPEECLGANAPGLELAQILHETQEARLFMS